MASSFCLPSWHRRENECQANDGCPNRREPGSRYCAYHNAVERARQGDPEAQRLCRTRWGLVVVGR